MLILLHLALWGDLGDALSRSLMLAHLGLFLMWQPLWNSELRLKWSSGLVFVLVAIAFVAWLDWWLMTFWLLMLTGIVGGRMTLGRTDRIAHLGTLLFLITELLIACVPMMFDVKQPQGTFQYLGYGLLVLPVMLYLIPAHSGTGSEGRVDFFYGLLISMLSAILALGSLLNTFYAGTPYITALFQTVIAIAAFLFAISWLWSPLAGFSGLGQLWERYLLNIGTPFEQWLGNVADSAESRATAPQFLRSSMQQLVALPWVSGASWRADGDESGDLGEHTKHSFRIRAGDIECTVYAHLEVGAALLLHGKLLIHLIGHFYSAKHRELELANSAHLQAIYETGARVTHDIKNLLQSLHTMTVALERGGDDPGAQELLVRQLPNLTQRLQLALDKLQAPGQTDLLESNVFDWWSGVTQRRGRDGIEFSADLGADNLIPVDLFDSVVENLLENARVKRQLEPSLHIKVDLRSTEDEIRLRVSDNGSAIEQEVAEHLFKGPVKSRNGLGIGLRGGPSCLDSFSP